MARMQIGLARRAACAIVAATGLGLATGAAAAPVRSAAGSYGEINWEAASLIVGTGSTATAVAGGNPVYFAPMPQYSGVVSIITTYASGRFICSGTLLPDRMSILTAAHCVSEGTDERPLSTTVYFYGGPDPDTIVHLSPDATARAVTEYIVHPLYTGQVIDQNDIAVLRLDALAPDFAHSYGLYEGNPLESEVFNIAGYGARSTIGGAFGANAVSGRLRQGDNRYEWRFGDSAFGGFWNGFFGTAPVEFSYLYDFDSGLRANDTGCRVAALFGLSGSRYCDTGLGLMEVGAAGGDSGGPQFIDGLIASITSYGLSFGPAFGDVRPGLNSSFGEFNGVVPVFIHLDFIRTAMVPEPATLLLLALAVLLLRCHAPGTRWSRGHNALRFRTA